MSTRSSQKAIQSAELLAHCSSYDAAFESTETKYGNDATGTSRVGAAQTTESAGRQLEGIVLRLKRQQAPQPRRLRPTSERSSNTLLSSSYHVMTNSKKSPEVSRQSEPSRLQSIPQVSQSSPKMCNSRGNSGIPGCLDATIDAVVQASHAIRPDVRMCSRQQTSGSRQSPREVVVSNEWAEAVEAFIEATDFVVPNRPFLEVLSAAAEQQRLKHRLQERERRARLLPTAKQSENLARQHAIRDAVKRDAAAGLQPDILSSSLICVMRRTKFATKFNLAKHVPVHKAKVSGGLPCSYCGKNLATKNSLKEHERIHTGERPFQCQFCPKTFRAQVSLLFHERAHLGDKRYKCNLCPKSFLQRSILDYHLTTHSGERPVKCEPCGKAFPTLPALRLHCKTQRHKDRVAGGAAKKSTTAESGGQKVFLDLSDRLNPRMEVVNQ